MRDMVKYVNESSCEKGLWPPHNVHIMYVCLCTYNMCVYVSIMCVYVHIIYVCICT